jgi:hypothetical protein
MTAAQGTHSGGGKLLRIVLVLGGLWMCVASGLGMETSLSVPGVGQIETQPHAVERHGAEAELVRESLSHGMPPQRWKCKDGKEYVFRYGADGMVDLMVMANGREITSFRTGGGYLSEVLQQDQCVQCNGYHDACGPMAQMPW